jgi:hypothetical protein
MVRPDELPAATLGLLHPALTCKRCLRVVRLESHDSPIPHCVARRRGEPATRESVIEKRHDAGLRSEHAYMAGLASIGLSFLAWTTSLKAEKAGTDRADRWGIFIGHWAPTFFGLGNALRSYEK